MTGRTSGPYIKWTDYGCEGWQPESFTILKEALDDPSFGSSFIITKAVKYSIVESEE